MPAHRLLLCAALLLQTTACTQARSGPQTLPFYTTPDLTPRWIEPNSSTHAIAPFSFRDQNGETITEKTFESKILVADFFFTTCAGICPKLTRSLATVQSAFENDDGIRLLSHSVSPDIDTVETLHAYAQAWGVKNGVWYLATGPREHIYGLARTSYFADRNAAQDGFLHTETLFLIDTNRRIRGVYNGTSSLVHRGVKASPYKYRVL